MNNLEWLYEHDRDFIADWVSKASYCRHCSFNDDCDGSMGADDPKCIRGNREWLMAGRVDAEQDNNGTCPDGNETCPNDGLAPENDVSTGDVDANDANETSREKYSEWIANLKCSEWMEKAHKLERERDELKSMITELQDQLESAHAKNRSLKSHISKMQEGRHGWHIKGKELQQQVNMLTEQRDHESAACRSYVRTIGTLRAERDRYRELCGKLLDAADDMRRVRDAFDQFERGEA